MKVMYIVSTLKRSGPIIQLLYIIKNLDRNKFKPKIITLSKEPSDTLKDKFIDLNVDIDSLNLSRVMGLFLSKSKLMNIINKEKPDIIHSHGIRADYLSSYYLEKFPRVSTLHNYPDYDYKMTYGKLKGKLMAIMHFNFLKKIELPIACSKSVSQMLLKNKSFKVDFIQNGVDINKYSAPCDIKKHNLKEKLKIPKDKKIFISVGHLSSRKDPVTIINGFKKSKISKQSHLLFLGDGKLKSKCINEIGELSNIQLVGRVDNVNEYLKTGDYFISSSLAEGLPNTVMESLSSGLPCLLSNIPPHREILEFNDRAGFLFKKGDINDLSQKLDKFLEVDYEEMSNAARLIIEDNLSAQIMSEKYQNKYVKLIRGNK